MHPKQIDQWLAAQVGVPFDMGWGWGLLHADQTVTRTCKGCAASVTSRVGPHGEVARMPFRHEPGCPVFERLYNNPGLS